MADPAKNMRRHEHVETARKILADRARRAMVIWDQRYRHEATSIDKPHIVLANPQLFPPDIVDAAKSWEVAVQAYARSGHLAYQAADQQKQTVALQAAKIDADLQLAKYNNQDIDKILAQFPAP